MENLAHGQVILHSTIKNLGYIIDTNFHLYDDDKVDFFKMFSTASREEVERQMIHLKLITDPNRDSTTELNSVNTIHDLVTFILLEKNTHFENIKFLKTLITYFQTADVKVADRLACYFGFVEMLSDSLDV